MIIYADHLELV